LFPFSLVLPVGYAAFALLLILLICGVDFWFCCHLARWFLPPTYGYRSVRWWAEFTALSRYALVLPVPLPDTFYVLRFPCRYVTVAYYIRIALLLEGTEFVTLLRFCSLTITHCSVRWYVYVDFTVRSLPLRCVYVTTLLPTFTVVPFTHSLLHRFCLVGWVYDSSLHHVTLPQRLRCTRYAYVTVADTVPFWLRVWNGTLAIIVCVIFSSVYYYVNCFVVLLVVIYFLTCWVHFCSIGLFCWLHSTFVVTWFCHCSFTILPLFKITFWICHLPHLLPVLRLPFCCYILHITSWTTFGDYLDSGRVTPTLLLHFARYVRRDAYRYTTSRLFATRLHWRWLRCNLLRLFERYALVPLQPCHGTFTLLKTVCRLHLAPRFHSLIFGSFYHYVAALRVLGRTLPRWRYTLIPRYSLFYLFWLVSHQPTYFACSPCSPGVTSPQHGWCDAASYCVVGCYSTVPFIWCVGTYILLLFIVRYYSLYHFSIIRPIVQLFIITFIHYLFVIYITLTTFTRSFVIQKKKKKRKKEKDIVCYILFTLLQSIVITFCWVLHSHWLLLSSVTLLHSFTFWHLYPFSYLPSAATFHVSHLSGYRVRMVGPLYRVLALLPRFVTLHAPITFRSFSSPFFLFYLLPVPARFLAVAVAHAPIHLPG